MKSKITLETNLLWSRLSHCSTSDMFRIGKYFVMFRAQPNRITKHMLSTTHVLPVPKYNHIEGIWTLINTLHI